MNEQDTTNEPKPDKKTPILIGLLLISVGVAGYLLYSNLTLKTEMEDLTGLKMMVEKEREEVKEELSGMLIKYDSLETDNDSISVELSEQREKVEQLLAKAKDNEWTIYKLRKEAATLREIMKGYVRTIDSLNTANIELQAKNVEVTEKLTQTRRYSQELESKNQELAEMVRMGARINALHILATAQQERRSGGLRETNRAKRADKIRTCLTLESNLVAKEGKRDVYVRVIAPGGRVLAKGAGDNYMFDYEGTRGLFTKKKEVYYEQKELDVCLFWDFIGEPESGLYRIEAYTDELKIGETTLELK